MKIDLLPTNIEASIVSFTIEDDALTPSFREAIAQISELRGAFGAHDVPGSWAPLLSYLSIAVGNTTEVFPSDAMVAAAWQAADYGRDMTATQLEALCSFRPETFAALMDVYTIKQMHPSPERYRYTLQDEPSDFIIHPSMRNGRASVSKLRGQIELFYPQRPNALILPNDPSTIDFAQGIIESTGIASDWYIIMIDAAVGMVPDTFIDSLSTVRLEAATSDFWRSMEELRDYFSRTSHSAVVTFVPSELQTPVEYGVSYSSHQGALFHAGGMGLFASESRLKLRAALLNHTAPKE